MLFKTTRKEQENAGQDSPVDGTNPYLNARREWLERYGDYIAQAHNWRIYAFIAIALLGLSLTGNVIQASQVKVLPYVVAVDSLGNTHAAGIPDALPPGDVPRQVVQAELANYVNNWRSVTADADLQKRMLNRLVNFSADSVKPTLQEWFDKNNPYKRAERTLVAVEMKGLPQQVSLNAWRVEWLEKEKDRQGKTLSETKYEATITVVILPPTTESEILANPMGITVAEIHFNKLLHQ